MLTAHHVEEGKDVHVTTCVVCHASIQVCFVVFLTSNLDDSVTLWAIFKSFLFNLKEGLIFYKFPHILE